MSRVIAAINLTIDGFCDHTAGIADEEIHDHYTKLLNTGDIILYGRKTYELMQFWQPFLKNPSGEKSMDKFAVAIDRIPKIVFSNTLKSTEWASANLADNSLEETVKELKQKQGNTIFVASRSLIVQLTNLNMIDEYQLCIHPVIIGKGLPLFENLTDRRVFNLVKTKAFKSGAVIHYYNRDIPQNLSNDNHENQSLIEQENLMNQAITKYLELWWNNDIREKIELEFGASVLNRIEEIFSFSADGVNGWAELDNIEAYSRLRQN